MSTDGRRELDLLSGGDAGSACACCAGETSAQDAPVTTAAAQDVLVDGMTCAHCVRSVTEEITAIDGVESVSVDLQAGGTSRVTIRSATPVDPERVRAAVEEAGYSLSGTAS